MISEAANLISTLSEQKGANKELLEASASSYIDRIQVLAN